MPRQAPTGDEWQLGPEPQERHQEVMLIESEPTTDLSVRRLTRTVQVVTVEHLAWVGLGIWALITRLLGLGMTPLASYEASHALFEYDLVNATNWASSVGYHPASAGWIHMVEAGFFAAVGANDFAARLIFAGAGLLTIGIAFPMRHHLGRAGAITAASLITVSPTFTYFSRASAIATVVAALAMVIIATFTALMRRPSLLHAIGLGIATGLLIAAGSTGLTTTAILLAALALTGGHQLLMTKQPCINLCIWLQRHAWTLLAATSAASFAWLGSQIMLFKPGDIIKEMETAWLGFGARSYLKGLDYYAPGMLLYEFLLCLPAIAGAAIIVSSRAPSRLARFSLLWMLISLAFVLGSRQRESERLLLLLLPMVMVGAIGIDYLHHTRAWPYARMVLLALGAATVYIQVLANFIYAAPAGNEAPWQHRANLYWVGGATTIEARDALSGISRRFPEQGGTVFKRGVWEPSLRWYLREFRPTSSSEMADLVVESTAPAANASGGESLLSVELQETWDPAIGALNAARAIRFVFTAEAWVPLRARTIAIMMRARSDSVPTLILPPP